MIKPQTLRETALQTWVKFLVVAGGILLLLFMYSIRSVILQLVIAAVLAIALTPLMKMLMKRGLGRVSASIITLFVTIIVLIGVVGAIASPLITQGDDLVRNAPALIEKAASNASIKELDTKLHFIERAKEFSAEIPEFLKANSKPLLGVVGSVFSAVSTTLVVLILMLFMLMEGPNSWAKFIRLLGRDQGKFVDGVAQKIVRAVGGFVNGNLLISLIAGIVTLVTLLIAGVPYAFALAALVAIFDLIPLVGATIATVVVALVALTQGLVVAIIVTAILLIYQFIEGNVIQTIVYGRAVKLSQLLIIVATIIGGLLGGVIGVLLAIPVAAAVQIIVVEILRANGADIDKTESKSPQTT